MAFRSLAARSIADPRFAPEILSRTLFLFPTLPILFLPPLLMPLGDPLLDNLNFPLMHLPNPLRLLRHITKAILVTMMPSFGDQYPVLVAQATSMFLGVR